MSSRATDPLATLRDRVDLLEEQVRQLRGAFGVVREIGWKGLRLRRMEWLCLEPLSSGRLCPHSWLLDRLDAASPSETAHDLNYLSVIIYRLRRKLRALDPPIAIDRVRGVGYQMDETNRRRLSERKRSDSARLQDIEIKQYAANS